VEGVGGGWRCRERWGSGGSGEGGEGCSGVVEGGGGEGGWGEVRERGNDG